MNKLQFFTIKKKEKKDISLLTHLMTKIHINVNMKKIFNSMINIAIF